MYRKNAAAVGVRGLRWGGRHTAPVLGSAPLDRALLASFRSPSFLVTVNVPFLSQFISCPSFLLDILCLPALSESEVSYVFPLANSVTLQADKSPVDNLQMLAEPALLTGAVGPAGPRALRC